MDNKTLLEILAVISPAIVTSAVIGAFATLRSKRIEGINSRRELTHLRQIEILQSLNVNLKEIGEKSRIYCEKHRVYREVLKYKEAKLKKHCGRTTLTERTIMMSIEELRYPVASAGKMQVHEMGKVYVDLYVDLYVDCQNFTKPMEQYLVENFEELKKFFEISDEFVEELKSIHAAIKLLSNDMIGIFKPKYIKKVNAILNKISAICSGEEINYKEVINLEKLVNRLIKVVVEKQINKRIKVLYIICFTSTRKTLCHELGHMMLGVTL